MHFSISAHRWFRLNAQNIVYLNFEYRILTWTQNFCELWYCNFWPKLMLQYYNLVQKFYAIFLSLPKGDLDLMHRILYVWILTKVKFKHATIVILNLYSNFRILWSNAMSYVNAIPELNGQNYWKWFSEVINCSSDV